MKRFLTGGRVFCLVMAVVMFALAVWAWFSMSQYTTESELLIQQHQTGVGALTDQPVTQRFRTERGGLVGINAMVSTYAKKLHEGTLTLSLADASGHVLAEMTKDVSELRNNAFISFPLDAPLGAGVYVLSATADCTEQKGVTLRMGPLKAEQADTVLTLADGTVDTDNGLNLTLDYQKAERGVLLAAILALLGLCALAAMPLAGRKESSHD